MLRIPISSHENHNFSLEQSLTAFGGAPFAQGSLGPYHAFDLLDKSEFEDIAYPGEYMLPGVVCSVDLAGSY